MSDRLEAIQRASGVIRYLLIGGASAIGVALVLSLVIPGQSWVIIGDGLFNKLWEANDGNRAALVAVTAPIGILILLGVYWLQRLFAEYQSGHFFRDGTMRCYIWLVWLKATNFFYAAVWPSLLKMVTSAVEDDQLPVQIIDAGTFLELIVLLVIVHVMKEAQKLSDENKAFV
jgi:hypothetical protein